MSDIPPEIERLRESANTHLLNVPWISIDAAEQAVRDALDRQREQYEAALARQALMLDEPTPDS